jgi:hypothetical protein
MKAAQQKGKILVHCMHGRSRSVFLVIAYVILVSLLCIIDVESSLISLTLIPLVRYLMWAKGWSFDQSFEYVKKLHPSARPNSTGTLKKFGKYLASKTN